jgi:Domain of unknown function (DUF4398)
MKTKRLFLALLLATSPLAAFASDRNDADLAITQASSAVDAAQRADAPQYAATDFGIAQQMLMSAHTAYDGRHWTDSIIDSENARVDANLAAARSRQARAEATTTELEQTVRTLREQMGVTAGGQL